MYLLGARPGENEEHLDGTSESPGSQCTLTLFGLHCACCTLCSQHPLQADFPDTISFTKSLGSLGSTWSSSGTARSCLQACSSFLSLLAKVRWCVFPAQSLRSLSRSASPGLPLQKRIPWPTAPEARPLACCFSLICSWGRGESNPTSLIHNGHPELTLGIWRKLAN